MYYVIVLRVSRQFPITHARAGESTRFIESIKMCEKIHTIRDDYESWNLLAKEINDGKAILSIRYWSGRPYWSNQIEICKLERIGVEKIEDPTNFAFAQIGDKQIDWETIAANDGLSFIDFCEWFKIRDKKPLAIIHFTDFRYAENCIKPD